MCGVVGVSLRAHVSPSEATPLAAAVLDQQRHRGPDGQGVVGLGATALGMARLRVRSAPGDSVPFTDAGGGGVFAFCGEVYRAGDRVPSGGLEEARWACGAAGGVAGVDGVDGMYAVVRGSSDEVLQVARDPLGIKPLYVRESADGVALASELAPLVGAFGPAPVRPEAFAQFLLTGRRVVDGGSFYQGIRPVAPGESLTVRAGEVVRSERAPTSRLVREALEPAQLREALEEAVDRTLLTDRQVGLALSGGLDSTVLARLLARRGIRDLPTVSVVPQDTGDGVRTLAELGLADGGISSWRHSWAPFGPTELLAGLPAAVRTFGEPVAMSSLPMYRKLAKLARASGITVLLVGEGADELFAGYNRYRALYGGAFTDPMDFYLSPDRLSLVTALLGPYASTAAVDALRAAVGRAERTSAERYDIEPSTVDVVREFEYEHSLEPLLRRTDHLLMAEGIEGRTPFLHAGVPELAMRYPATALVRGDRTKAALREAFADLLPARYLTQPKQPFRAPVDQWLQGPLLPRVDRTLAEAAEPLRERLGVRAEGLLELRKRLTRGDAMAFTVAFALLSTVEWLDWLRDPWPGAEVHDGAGH